MVSRGRRPSAAEGEVWAEEDSAAEEAPNGSKPRARPRAALSRRRSAIKANEQGFAAGDAFAGNVAFPLQGDLAPFLFLHPGGELQQLVQGGGAVIADVELGGRSGGAAANIGDGQQLVVEGGHDGAMDTARRPLVGIAQHGLAQDALPHLLDLQRWRQGVEAAGTGVAGRKTVGRTGRGW